MILCIALIAAAGCKHPADLAEKRIEPVYDRMTGRLQLVKYDSDGDGRPDVWTYLDDRHVVRSESDTNHDGKVDRWNYYDAAQRATRIGLSTKHDRVQDRSLILDASGIVTRRDHAGRRRPGDAR